MEEIKVAFRTGGVLVQNWQGGVFDPAQAKQQLMIIDSCAVDYSDFHMARLA